MLIRSQDKEILVNFNVSAGIEIAEGTTKTVVPKASGTYQVTCMDGRIYRSTYAKFQCKLKRWELTGARSYWKVIAWMPLPNPYKED